jgi:hypothetical protein
MRQGAVREEGMHESQRMQELAIASSQTLLYFAFVTNLELQRSGWHVSLLAGSLSTHDQVARAASVTQGVPGTPLVAHGDCSLVAIGHLCQTSTT